MAIPIRCLSLKTPFKRIQIDRQTFLICSLLLFPWILSAAEKPTETNNKVTAFLAQAKQAINRDHLTTPSEDNAVKYVEQILSLVPKHPEATKLLVQITDRYNELISARFKHSKQAQQDALTQAKIFHKRAQHIINQHSLSNTALVAMKHKIAKYEASIKGKNQFDLNQKATRASIENLLDQHLALTESALGKHNIKDAQWHTKQAETIANRYRISDPKLKLLKNKVLSVAASNRERNTQEIKELIASHIKLGKQALNKRDADKAQIHQSIAEELALQYGINNPNLKTSSNNIAKQSAWSQSDTWLKIFGTF